MQPGYDRWGSDPPASPVVLSVSHAGRDYPPDLLDALRVPASALQGLEDRHVDAVALGVYRDETVVVQRRARAWIDLNRSEEERDPRVDDGASPGGRPPSAKLRSGLGLVPRRVAGAGDLWRARFAGAAIDRRIADDHRPYHAELARSLVAARQRFGTAVLLDLHSMPPLGQGRAQLVIGDRHGRTAGARFTRAVEAVIRRAGPRVAINLPYAGGHIVDRHGQPALNVHAVQLELDRSLYLDASLGRPGPGLVATVALVRDIVDALAAQVAGPADHAILAAE